MKPLRDLQSNSPLLVLIMDIIGARLAEHLQITLPGRILFVFLARPHCALLHLRHKLKRPICFLYVHWSPARPLHCNAVFDKVQVWIWVNKAALHSWIFNLLHAQQWKAVHLVLHREQIWSCSSQPRRAGCAEHSPAWLWDGRDPKSTEATGSLSIGFACFLDQLHGLTGLSLIIKAEYRSWQRSRASLTYARWKQLQIINTKWCKWCLSENCWGAVSPPLNLDSGESKSLLHPKHLS